MIAYQEECKQRAIANGAYIGDNYLGMPTDEPPIRAFRGLHAKCYAVEEYNKKTDQYELKVTIAGIPKKATKWIDGKPVTMTNAEELGDIENLTDGFKFSHCGGTRCIYVEQPPEIVNIRGHETEIASAAIIENIDKEISDNMWCAENSYLLNMNEKQVLE